MSHFQDDLEVASLIEAASRMLTAISGRDQKEELKALLSKLQDYGGGPEFSQFLGERFSAKMVEGAQVTGYYQPELQGSLEPTEHFCYPLYACPEGPLPERSAIDSCGALSGRGLEMAWLSDPIERFFLHIQGSGKLKLPSGESRQLLFAGHNNRTYFPIGAELLKRGVLEPGQVSMQSIKAYLRQHPEQMQEILNLNPRYVFFKLAEEGPIGTCGSVLTPLRSIATDWNIYPSGALCHLQIPLPQLDQKGSVIGRQNSSFFAFNQDTGGAIIGAGRVDLYFGAGQAAGALAGGLNCRGILTVLTSRQKV